MDVLVYAERKKKKTAQLRELLRLEPVSSVPVIKDRLAWFGYAERKDDADWVKWYTMMDTGTRRERRERLAGITSRRM